MGDLEDKLFVLYKNEGFNGFTLSNLQKHDLLNDINKLLRNEKYKYDIDHYCSILLSIEDDYITFISICDD